jgi:hypothetical protein
VGWPEWVQVSNMRLMESLQIYSEKKFIEIRDELIKRELFIYERGKKGCPSKYKIHCQMYFPEESPNAVQMEVNPTVQMTVQVTDISKRKLNKTKHNTFSLRSNVLEGSVENQRVDFPVIPTKKVAPSKKTGLTVSDKSVFGEFENVFLTTAEFEKFVSRAGKNEALELIEQLSRYIASKGKKYKSHYATLLNWLGNPKSALPISANNDKSKLSRSIEALEKKYKVPEYINVDAEESCD